MALRQFWDTQLWGCLGRCWWLPGLMGGWGLASSPQPGPGYKDSMSQARFSHLCGHSSAGGQSGTEESCSLIYGFTNLPSVLRHTAGMFTWGSCDNLLEGRTWPRLQEQQDLGDGSSPLHLSQADDPLCPCSQFMKWQECPAQGVSSQIVLLDPWVFPQWKPISNICSMTKPQNATRDNPLSKIIKPDIS